MYRLTKEQLSEDLRKAYADACRHKKCKHYIQRFNRNLDERMDALCDDLWTRSYEPLPSSCFIVTYPKRREVFAAEFRDRIVHHLYYNYTWELFRRTFIQDTYSCVPDRGTHYGIDRLEQHIRQESRGYSERCYVLKMDISGYFMHIDRQRLLGICLDSLHRMADHRILSRVPTRWCDRIDMDFIEYLTREIVLLDPTQNCRIVGNPSDWDDLPYGKSLFQMPEGRGLPIGNLTSQLFSNVYLNVLDQWMKRTVGCKHYGRYVDDFFVVSRDRRFLLSLVPRIAEFLDENLALNIQQGKTTISEVGGGVSFLGAFLRPGIRYPENKTIRNMRMKLRDLSEELQELPYEAASMRARSSLNSYLGVLRHYRSYNLCQRLMTEERDFSRYGFFSLDMTKFHPYLNADPTFPSRS